MMEFVSIKELAQILHMSVDALQPKIPNKYKLKIGKSVRYDLHAIIEHFRVNNNEHHQLINKLLEN